MRPPPLQLASEPSALEETQLLTSIYFDSPQAVCYKERIRRLESARLLRFRWYGQNDGSKSKEVFVERKVHHESWTYENSTKDRFCLQQRHIFPFMKGQFDVDQHFSQIMKQAEIDKGPGAAKKYETQLQLAQEVTDMLHQLNMQPMIRTSYYRCAFQLSTDNAVRVSLDTQMVLINEYRTDGHVSEPWCRVATDVLAENDLIRFPYAVLEVKLQGKKSRCRGLSTFFPL